MERDFGDYLRVLSKRKWYLVFTLAVAVGAATLIAAGSTRIYQADATLFVGQRQIPRQDIGDSAREAVAVSDLSFRLLTSYSEVLTSRTVAERADAEFDLEASPREIQQSLRAAPIANTQLIQLSATSSDPSFAQRITNAVADVFVQEIVRLDSSAAGDDPLINVSVLDRATVPSGPIAPETIRIVLTALALGLGVGVGLVLLVDRLDVTIKQPNEIESAGLTVLASIPVLAIPRDVLYLEQDTQGPGGEAFRKLRTSVGFVGVEEPLQTILVTSPGPTEGKTTIALNLAAAFALGGLRTILVEADLRRPSLHQIFGMRGTKGLTTAIVGQVDIPDAIAGTDVPNLSVMLAGAIPPNPVELLGSDQMVGLLKRLKSMFDVVIVDSPPLIPVADPAVLAGHCDGVVLVTRAGKTDRRRLSDSAQIVDRVRGRTIGAVLNFLRRGDDNSDYGYYYAYTPSVDETPTSTEKASRA